MPRCGCGFRNSPRTPAGRNSSSGSVVPSSRWPTSWRLKERSRPTLLPHGKSIAPPPTLSSHTEPGLLSPQFSMPKSSAAIRRKADPPDQTLVLRVPLCPRWLKLAVQLKASLGSAIARLTADQVPSPRLNAELLLMFTLNCDRASLFAHPERELSAEEQTRYDDALSERARGVPAQYITGHQEFWGMDLIVTPAVLIPRPETEHLIETLLSLATRKRAGGQPCPPHSSPLRFLDVGTGSGCIALALAKEFPDAEIHATDISAAALEVARANAARLQLEKRIRFRQAD